MIRKFVLGTAVVAATALPALPALAHAEVTPTAVEAGQAVTLNFTSIVEREALINTDFRIVVPRQWEVIDCAGPPTWVCEIDRETYAPDVLVDYSPLVATPADVNFSLDVVAPSDEADLGAYSFRSMQIHADDWAEPWVYDAEPYPAPKVTVAGVTDLVNGEGSEFDPPCFGPTVQPADYGSHDGKEVEEGCTFTSGSVPSQPASEPTTAPAPAPVPAPEPAPARRGDELPATGGGLAFGGIVAAGAELLRRRF